MKHLSALALAALLLTVACKPAARPRLPGDVYRRIARPEIWQTVPSAQAERLGLAPGDLLISYNLKPVATNSDVIAAIEPAVEPQPHAPDPGPIPITVLRSNRELDFKAAAGPLGVLPVAMRFPSSLAIALEDIMLRLGLFADYDWLAALSGESFALAAHDDACRAWWPAEASGSYLEDLALMAGIELVPLSGTDGGDAQARIREALDRNKAVLVFGGWPGYRHEFWGTASRFDPSVGEMGLLLGYTIDSSEELPLSGRIIEAYVVEPGSGWDDPDEILALALTQALELGLARSDNGRETGLQAYDRLIMSLDSIPFCPACGPQESPVCFERLLWSLVAHKQSAIRFMRGMRASAPDLAPLFDEIVGDLTAQVGKLEGIARSGARIGDMEGQQKIARTFGEIQIIENDLLGLYEALLAQL